MIKSLETITKKMFKIVKTDYPKNESYFKKQGWFLKHSVTEEQQDRFREWMIDYLEKNREARIDFGVYRKNGKQIESDVNMFILNYFWRVRL